MKERERAREKSAQHGRCHRQPVKNALMREMTDSGEKTNLPNFG